MEHVFFKATWGTFLTNVTIAVSVVMGLVALIGLGLIIKTSTILPGLAMMSMILIPLIASIFTVQGYVLKDQMLYVERLNWRSPIDLTHLVSVEVDPNAMDGSIRVFGNGGLFSVTGYFYSKKLGKYRAYVTALHRCVVLKFSDRTIVVSPDHPETFREAILAQLNEGINF